MSRFFQDANIFLMSSLVVTILSFQVIELRLDAVKG